MNKKNPIIDKLGEIDPKFTKEYYNVIKKRAVIRKSLINICSIVACLLVVTAISTATVYSILQNGDPVKKSPAKDTEPIEESTELTADDTTADSCTETTADSIVSCEPETEGTVESTEEITEIIEVDISTQPETEEITEIIEQTEEITESVENDLPETETEKHIVNIKVIPQSIVFPELEEFYKDDTNFYYFPYSNDSQYIIVEYSDGTSQNAKAAINEGYISISDLDTFGIKYYTQKRADRGPIKNIKDHSLTDGGEYQNVESLFYEDYFYSYYFNSDKERSVKVYFENGDEISVRRALSEGSIDIEDLDTYGIEYIKKPN